MGHLITMAIGVVVSRERINHAWQDVRWQPVSVFMDPPPQTGPWQELLRSDGYIHFHAATLLLELRHTEIMSYQVNLANGEPSVYVVMRDSEERDYPPVEPYLVTASPFEAQAHGESGFEVVERVAMPDQLIEVVEAFIKEHHRELSFDRGRRQPPPDDEPVFVLSNKLDKNTPKKTN